MVNLPLHRILFAERDPAIREAGRLALEVHNGMTVQLCSTGAEVLAAAPHFKPDVMILGSNLSDMRIGHLLNTLRQAGPLAKTPIVVTLGQVKLQEVASFKALGVIAAIPAPFNPMALPLTLRKIWTKYQKSQRPDPPEALKALCKAYAQGLPDKVADLERYTHALFSNTATEEGNQVLQRVLHNLVGSSATFGFSELSQASRVLETAVLDLLKAGNKPTISARARTHGLLGQVMQMADAAYQGLPAPTLAPEASTPPAPALTAASTPGAPKPNAKRPIFVVDDDPDQSDYLTTMLRGEGHTVVPFTTLESFQRALAEAHPAAVIMDLTFPEGELAGAQLIAEIQAQRTTALPVLFVSAREDLQARLSTSQVRGARYFAKPLNKARLLQALGELSQPQASTRPRVLIVDDDTSQAEYFGLLLNLEDMETMVVNEPEKVLDALGVFTPDLILMDINMPGLNGFELTTIIRQHEVFAHTPVLFLSAETGTEMQSAAVSAGGDGFLDKLVTPEQLTDAVRARATQGQRLRKTA